MGRSEIPVQDDVVILLHGLGRSRLAMLPLEWGLLRGGYRVINKSYPSRRLPVELLVGFVGERIEECRQLGAQRIHFIGHSFGGILVRAWFQQNSLPEAGRVVMLGSPNQGSEIVDRYGRYWWFRAMTGQVGQQLGTSKNSFVSRLGPIVPEVGIIAGSVSSDPWFAHVFSGPNDGKVSVKSTGMPGMRDHIVLPYGHTLMPWSGEVIGQAMHFLREGKFRR